MTAPPRSILDLTRFKRAGQKIVTVTAYDYTFARLVDSAGVDIILVGDSLGMVVQGHDTTLPVTLDEMIYHTRLVRRGTRQALVVCDLPFGSFQTSPEETSRAATRVMKESCCHAVKLEGGVVMEETIRFLTQRSIPVLGHVGLTPQSVHAFGGFKVQGRGEEAAQQVVADALAVQAAGAFAIVLEGMPAPLAARISQQLTIPTIGIGAGAGCDGQVLVLYDLLGLFDEVKPKFVKRYLEGGALVRDALTTFAAEVRAGTFPTIEHSFKE